MKKSLRMFFVVTLMLLVTISLVACGGNENERMTNAPFGEKYPEKIKTKYSINANMDALKMYEAGVKNYNEIEFVASRQIGTIITETVIGNLNQSVDSTKIKQDSKLYFETNTITTNNFLKPINLIDQSIYENGKYRVRTAGDKQIAIKDGVATVKTWNGTEDYNSLAEGLKKYPNDPSRVNMYIINENTVISSTKPIYDAKNNIYKFELVLDNSLATRDYLNNMYYNVKAGGVTDPEIAFTKLNLVVEMWDNGLIKSIANDENYDVKGKMGFTVNNKTAFIATTYFTYDKTECNIKNYIKF